VFTQQRAYAYVMVLNMRRPTLNDRTLRRRLNAAINRPELIERALAGHAVPAESPVWPFHWAFSADAPKFTYDPVTIREPVRLRCLIADDASLERLALSVQQM